ITCLIFHSFKEVSGHKINDILLHTTRISLLMFKSAQKKGILKILIDNAVIFGEKIIFVEEIKDNTS
ncbi:MAG: hypothetical protein LBQ78_01895, partial [Tannerellaceae bacterium]|nr:hypothetical protein [Tannerellaceae bacterium]